MREEADGGFFIHTGKTGELAKEWLQEYQISLISDRTFSNMCLIELLAGKNLCCKQ